LPAATGGEVIVRRFLFCRIIVRTFTNFDIEGKSFTEGSQSTRNGARGNTTPGGVAASLRSRLGL
jgi:hypothetical protein